MSSVQPLALLYSFLLGAGLGLLFAVLEVLRILLQPGRILRFLVDLLFCLLAALTSFVLALAVANGTMRFFQAGGELLGFVCVQLTVTWAVRRFLPRVRLSAQRITKRVENFFAGKIRGICKFMPQKVKKKGKKAKKITKRA